VIDIWMPRIEENNDLMPVIAELELELPRPAKTDEAAN
jgi:hypothetical protein